MEHALAAPDALVRPWRTAAYIAGAIALVELVLLLLIGGNALVKAVSHRIELAATESALAPSHASRPATPAAAKRKVERVPPATRPRTKTVVLVLNGNGRSGAAASAASRVHRRGYRIAAVGNAARSDFRQSIVMFRPGFAGEGHRLARDLRVRMVGPLDGIRARQLGRAQLVFILGT